jgi:HEAT repeat protein
MRSLPASLLLVLFLTASARADVNSLMADLSSKDADIRRSAASELGKMGPDAKPAFSALVKALKDEDKYVRRFSALAIGNLGSDVKGAAAALSVALKDREKVVVQAAADALAKTGPEGVKPLTDLVKDKGIDAVSRKKAVESLGKIGKVAKDAVPDLVEVLKSAGGRRPDQAALNLRMEVVVTLGQIGPDAKEAVAPLEELNMDRNVRDRQFKQAIQQALRKIKASDK